MRIRHPGWTVSFGVTLSVAVLGIVCLLVVRFGPLDAVPWAYIGLALAGAGAVASLLHLAKHAHDVTEE
ncbi:hypothetical protein [Aeromicrobium piscarium]|uniref:Uncharacterized protein n=1 Tax=Aeromicrobium piscarium TaxID=2590901 RepID=A0A554SFM1_9ACTN|nr:hypothetical protein [Aeromicrobium piscarium]TSD65113.1 hypothetical protein FNM00_05240 [Aeromicrobium piscarium]